jgi:endonuclease-3
VDTLGAEAHYNEEDSPNEKAFQVMVGVLLSVQSNDIVTDRVMKGLLKDGVSIDKYYKLTQPEIQKKISGINFNKNKSIFIKAAAQKIVDDFGGKVPSTLKELTSFKGIGPKVAHLILQIGFNKTTGIAVDVHVHRISNRLGFVKWTKDAKKTMSGLMEKFDKKYWSEINPTLVGMGQLICGKLRPKCDQCPIRSECTLGSHLLDLEDLGKKESVKTKSSGKKSVKKD